jgi:hypothetical protein
MGSGARKGKPMSIEIFHFRQSFIWAATLLGPNGPTNPQLGVRADYAALFDFARANGTPLAPFAVPWPNDKPEKHYFWANYLAAFDPSSVPGDTAWARAVPLRVTGPSTTASMEDFAGSISIEHYLYPFGAGLVVTFADKQGPYQGEDWVDLLISNGQQPLAVTFPDGKEQSMPLEDLARASLTRMRVAHFGSDAAELASVRPFVVTTVISGSGVDAAAALGNDGPIHRILYGAASRRPNYRDAVLPTIEEAKLCLRKGASPGDIVFAVSRGRTIWLPSSFVTKPEELKQEGGAKSKRKIRKTSMSCYHRNQVFAALQAESLGRLTHELVTRLDGKPDGNLPNKINQFGRIPAALLADMHDGKKTTYCSNSLKRQIDDSNLKDAIGVLRTKYALPTWPSPTV